MERCLEYKEWSDLIYVEYRIPRDLHSGLNNYLKHHIEPGSFLMSVLTNDLRGAVLRWSGHSALNPIKQLVDFLNAECPATCHGSPEIVAAWLAAKTAV